MATRDLQTLQPRPFPQLQALLHGRPDGKWIGHCPENIDPMFGQCLASVVDGGIILVQHWSMSRVCWVT